MLITFHCSHCNAKLRIDADAMGSELNCPECDEFIHVPHQEFGPGFVVGGFAIKHKIGQGGMGEVYLARQLSMERDVALKILPPQFTRQGNFVVRFLKEVHYQAKLDHPNIVTAFEAGEDNGVYFMAMAYVEGETLEEYLEREGAMSESTCLDIVRQVATALRYASEEKAILHRDIKPGNIMITPSRHAKVLDMGLSKSAYDTRAQTHNDTLMGTPNYMSPEQIDTPQSIDTRSDMFSLGMTLYHMLTGQIPFEESSYLQTLKRHANEPLEDPRHLMPGISRGAVILLERLLARSPDDRFATWSDLLDAVDAVSSRHGENLAHSAGPSTLKPDPELDAPAPSSVPPPLSPRPRIKMTGLAQSVAAGLLIGLVGILILSRILPAKSPSLPAPPPTPTPVMTASATPVPTPVPTAVPIPTVNPLEREFAACILYYEQHPEAFDEVLVRLRDIGTRGEGTEVSSKAAEQILRIRRQRESDILNASQTLERSVMTLLRSHGATEAMESLQAYSGPYLTETQALRDRLQSEIRMWERQEQIQREQEERAAQDRFLDLVAEVAPAVYAGNWVDALRTVDQASTNALLFAAANGVTLLREEIAALQKIPATILGQYRSILNQETNLILRTGPVQVKIREIVPGSLIAVKTVRDEAGVIRGTAEQIIPFSQLSTGEVIRRMENLTAPRHDLYRGILAQRNNNLEAAKHFYQQAGTPLALALANRLPRPAPTPVPTVAPWMRPQVEDDEMDPLFDPAGPPPGEPEFFNTPRFGPEPTPAWPEPPSPSGWGPAVAPEIP